MASTGVVLRLTREGAVLDVLYDSIGTSARDGHAFIDVLASGSLAKGLSFLRTLTDDGATLDWELDVQLAGGFERLRFGGVEDDETLLVIGSSGGDYERFLRLITGVNNELTNRLRAAAGAQRAQLTDVRALNDLTELNNELTNLHRELARTSAELAALNERKDLMLGTAAHDLRNPLGAIMGFAELIETRAADRLSESELALLRHIQESSRRMARLVDDLLDVSAIEAGVLRLEIAPHDLVALVRGTVELERPRAQVKSIEIRIAVAHEPVIVPVDPDKLTQVVQNLVSNAVKYSHRDTVVEVRIGVDADEVRVEVADQGQGIPSDALADLFEPFVRAGVRTTGGETSTGLGLAIVRNIIDAHGGRIEVDSAVGVGSSFTFVLPRSDASS